MQIRVIPVFQKNSLVSEKNNFYISKHYSWKKNHVYELFINIYGEYISIVVLIIEALHRICATYIDTPKSDSIEINVCRGINKLKIEVSTEIFAMNIFLYILKIKAIQFISLDNFFFSFKTLYQNQALFKFQAFFKSFLISFIF